MPRFALGDRKTWLLTQLSGRKVDITKPQRRSPGVRKDVVMKRRASPFPKKQAQCSVFACNSVADFRSVDLGDLDVDTENLGIALR